MRLYYCDHHPIPLPAGHKFPITKYALLRGMLEADGAFELAPAPFAAVEALERVHDTGYVRAILDGSVDPRIMRRIGFPWSEQLVRRTLASVGGTLAAASDALSGGVGGNLAGGTHHAFRGEGSGFCVFNDLAVAVRACGRRAAVIDLDVHQGDGTASIFEHDPDVLTVSLHGENNFPFHKQRSKIDLGLRDGTADDEYLERLGTVLPAVREFSPRILFYQSGVDGLEADRLGRLRLSLAGLCERDRMVFDLARVMDVPVVVTLGGGYAEPISLTAEAHAGTFRTAAAVLGRHATDSRGSAS
jgi:acetoin utilization deacetylase AcuC-like enzyme